MHLHIHRSYLYAGRLTIRTYVREFLVFRGHVLRKDKDKDKDTKVGYLLRSSTECPVDSFNAMNPGRHAWDLWVSSYSIQLQTINYYQQNVQLPRFTLIRIIPLKTSYSSTEELSRSQFSHFNIKSHMCVVAKWETPISIQHKKSEVFCTCLATCSYLREFSLAFRCLRSMPNKQAKQNKHTRFWWAFNPKQPDIQGLKWLEPKICTMN